MEKGKRQITTTRHFEIFKREAELWIGRLGLTDWRIDFKHKNSPDGIGARAWFGAKVGDRIAEVGLAVDWDPDVITVHRVRETAFHEVFEIMLCPLGWIGDCRYAREEEIPEAKHVIIRRFENLFYGNRKERLFQKV